MKEKRLQRLSHQIRDEISSYLQRGEIKDPNIGFASISHVKLSRDLQQAKIFVSVYGPPQDQQNTIKALNRAKNFIRHLLIKNLYIKKVPHLTFILDDSIAKSVELVHKIDKLFENRPENFQTIENNIENESHNISSHTDREDKDVKKNFPADNLPPDNSSEQEKNSATTKIKAHNSEEKNDQER